MHAYFIFFHLKEVNMLVLKYYLSLTWFIHIVYRIHALTAILNSREKQVSNVFKYLHLPACSTTSLDQTPRWKFRIQSVILSIFILWQMILFHGNTQSRWVYLLWCLELCQVKEKQNGVLVQVTMVTPSYFQVIS